MIPNNAEINTVDAERRGIKDGDISRTYNDGGEIRITTTVTERIMPGVVNVAQGAWFKPDKRGIDRGGLIEEDALIPCIARSIHRLGHLHGIRAWWRLKRPRTKYR